MQVTLKTNSAINAAISKVLRNFADETDEGSTPYNNTFVVAGETSIGRIDGSSWVLTPDALIIEGHRHSVVVVLGLANVLDACNDLDVLEYSSSCKEWSDACRPWKWWETLDSAGHCQELFLNLASQYLRWGHNPQDEQDLWSRLLRLGWNLEWRVFEDDRDRDICSSLSEAGSIPLEQRPDFLRQLAESVGFTL